jgi:hypothetical protein
MGKGKSPAAPCRLGRQRVRFMQEIDQFSDWKLVAIEKRDESPVLLLKLMSSTDVRWIAIYEVQELRMDDFKNENVVDCIKVFASGDAEEKYGHLLSDLLFEQDLSKLVEAQVLTLRGYVKKIMSGQTILVSLEAIYGAQLLALASAFKILEKPPTSTD